MRVLAVCEAPPTIDQRAGDGSTLISREVFARLAADIEIDLLFFGDRDVPVDDAVVSRCRRVQCLPLRSALAGAVTVPVQRHPRATWLRGSRVARDAVARRSVDADVTYLHGLHTFGLGDCSAAPVVVNEVDPWSKYWAERAANRGGVASVYDRLQAARARRLESHTASLAASYIVVNAADATALGQSLGRLVDAVPNGAPTVPAPVLVERSATRIAFVGTLDYTPNVDAARRLALEVLPAVRRAVPAAHVVIAGRRPTDEVLALAGDGVEVRPDVPSVQEIFATAAVAAYPTVMGRGTKNSVLEALGSGCPVVATAAAASGLHPGPHLMVVESPAVMADRVVGLLRDTDACRAAGAAGRRYAETLPSWDDVAETYAQLLRRAARSTTRSVQPKGACAP